MLNAPGILNAWHFFVKLSIFQATPRKQGISSKGLWNPQKVFGIPNLTWMLLISSLGFTAKAKIPTLRPDFLFFSLSLFQAPMTRGLSSSYVPRHFFALHPVTPVPLFHHLDCQILFKLNVCFGSSEKSHP